jgi:DNA adenine methylase
MTLTDTSQNQIAPGLSHSTARPFIKWAGGKTRLLASLLQHVPERFRRYHEPFLGGGALLFAVHRRGNLAACASDLNPELVNAWRVVASRAPELHERLRDFMHKDSAEFYYAIRAARFEEEVDRAAHFLYLNRTSWNGLYRVNRWGEFNVPWGARAFVAPSLAALEAVAVELAGVDVGCTDFREALTVARRGDFVYLDPPYLKISDTSKFNGYTQQRFRRRDLLDLARQLDELSTKGVRWVLSNRDSAEMRELFHGHEFVRLTVRRSVAAQNRRDIEPPASPEVIVSNRSIAGW